MQNESAAAASHTAAIMSLNLKLQSAATRNQARNIDHELKRIEANESKEMLNIIQVMSIGILVYALLTTTTYYSRICPRFTSKQTPMQRDAISFSREWLPRLI